MSIFSEQIVKLVNDYKRLLKRYVSTSEREKIITNLGIKRKSLRYDSDAILYNKALRILEDINYWKVKIERSATEYSGVDEFYQHLQSYLRNFRIEQHAVVNIHHRVSSALVNAIQIITMPETTTVNSTAVKKLDDYITTVVKFGTRDQRMMLAKTVKKQQDNHPIRFSTPSLDHFIKMHCEIAEA